MIIHLVPLKEMPLLCHWIKMETIIWGIIQLEMEARIKTTPLTRKFASKMPVLKWKHHSGQILHMMLVNFLNLLANWEETCLRTINNYRLIKALMFIVKTISCMGIHLRTIIIISSTQYKLSHLKLWKKKRIHKNILRNRSCVTSISMLIIVLRVIDWAWM